MIDSQALLLRLLHELEGARGVAQRPQGVRTPRGNEIRDAAGFTQLIRYGFGRNTQVCTAGKMMQVRIEQAVKQESAAMPSSSK